MNRPDTTQVANETKKAESATRDTDASKLKACLETNLIMLNGSFRLCLD